MKAQPEGDIAVVEAYWTRAEGRKAWEARVARSGVRQGRHWTTLEITEADGRRLLKTASHSPDVGAIWIVDASGCVVRAAVHGPIVRRVLSSLLERPQACGEAALPPVATPPPAE